MALLVGACHNKDKKYEHFFSNDIEGVARRGLDIQNMIEIWVREIENRENRGQTLTTTENHCIVFLSENCLNRTELVL